MKNYLIIITWENPYPKPTEYRVQGSSIEVAIGKAVRQFRKDNKGRRITKYSLTAEQL